MLQLLTRCIFVLGMGMALWPACLHACTLCFGFPDRTAVDYLMQADCVLLAREDGKRPFTYAPVEILKGAHNGRDIDLLVDSVTRRRLRADASLTVVLVCESRDGKWRNLGFAGENYEALVRRIIRVSDAWHGDDRSQQRWEFFLPLFGHSNPRIRQLAYLEMGRAPYPVIKRLGRVVSREDYETMLIDPRYLEWKSLAILLLAQSSRPQDRQFVMNSFRFAHRFESMNLAAWIAAAIEVEGESVISFVEQEYFRHEQCKPDAIDAALKALSMHGSQNNPALQDRIVNSYAVLLRRFPQFAPQVADDLNTWKRSELAGVLSTILERNESLDLAGKQAIGRYLAAVKSNEEQARDPN